MSSSTEEKKKRGRPPKRPQQAVSGMRQQALNINNDEDDDDEEERGEKKARTISDSDADSSTDNSDDENQVLAAFRGGPRAAPAICTIPKPDFGDQHHMWFQTTQVGHMATLFKALSGLLSGGANVIFAPGGWRITAMNSKHTALISLRVTEQTMEEGIYECNYNYRISVPIDELAARIRMCRRFEVMTMELRGEQPKDLRMVFSCGRRVTEMDLQLRQPDDVHVDTPTLTYHSQVDLPAEELREVVNSVKSDTLITDVEFTKYPRKFTVTVQTVHGPIHTHFLPDSSADSVRFLRAANTPEGGLQEEPVSADATSSTTVVSKSTFALKEIIGFSGVTRASKWVRINMPELEAEQQLPLRMAYDVAALGHISFLLAPKFDDDDDATTTATDCGE